MRILLVEDDPNLGKATSEGLRVLYAVDWVKSAEEAEEALATVDYALIILDINLPGATGLDFLSQIRKKGDNVPVLFLSARDSTRHRVEGLNAGADDYLVKPFDLDELFARCAALLRRTRNMIQNKIICQNVSYEPGTGYIEQNGFPVVISSRERSVLDSLMRNIGRAVSKEKIMQEIYDWSSDNIESNTIEVHIASLRRKLGKDFIKTRRGIGYVIEK